MRMMDRALNGTDSESNISDDSDFPTLDTDELEQTNYNLSTSRAQAPKVVQYQQSAAPGRALEPQRNPSSSAPSTNNSQSTRDESYSSEPRRQLNVSMQTAPNRPNRPVKNQRKKPALRKLIPNIHNEINTLNQRKGLLMPRAPFARLVREIFQCRSVSVCRITPIALEALQESVEIYLVQMFQDAFRITMNRNQVTLHPKDVELLRYIRGESNSGQP